MTQIKVYNSYTRKKEAFNPIDPNNVRMYVCGVTPYDYAHIGNARPAIVFDTLFRFLKTQFPKVTYLRNFTDVDDKIINRANEQGVSPEALSQKFIRIYHADMAKLNVYASDDFETYPHNKDNKIVTSGMKEPLVTGHISEIVAMISVLLEKRHAYVGKSGDVLYDTTTFPEYGKLAGKKLDELNAGARVAVSDDKRNPTDFVLWKSAKPGEPSWPFNDTYADVNAGRPGWHIECSAMIHKRFGHSFDIHAGGEDLQFPHHDCEIAQSKSAFGGDYARFWMHNAFINVGGEKMSKSLGNFTTVHQLLEKYSGEAIRLWMLSTHYRKPIDLTQEALDAAEKSMAGLMRAVAHADDQSVKIPEDFYRALGDDMNTPQALALLYAQAKKAHVGDKQAASVLKAMADVLGLLQQSPEAYLRGGVDASDIDALVAKRDAAKKAQDWAEADQIRDALKRRGVILEDSPQGTTWRKA